MATCDHLSVSGNNNLLAFSQTLFEIYRLAREEPIERFLETMLECVQVLIPFKSAWWGMGSRSLSTIECMNNSYFYNLPETYFHDWKKIKQQDTTLIKTHECLGEAISLSFSRDDISSELRSLGKRYQYDKLMCLHFEDQITCLGNHLSLYRDRTSPEFTNTEKLLFQALIPHLLSASTINQIRSHYQLFGAKSDIQVALATCSEQGLLFSSEPAFAELMQAEYPDWQGPQLPFTPSIEGISGKHLVVEVFAKGEQFMLAARPVCAIEQLSNREQEVAVLFGSGATYKEIARDLGVSPNTVRYHLRSIYLKLGTSNKADLSRFIQDVPSIVSS